MTYITKYTVPFVSMKGISYVVKIQKDGYSGSVTELTGAANPFTVDINESSFLYAPSRFSGASLRIVTDNYMDELFSTNPHEWRVLLERSGVVVWRGFIQPEIFTQDFSTSPVELEIGCVSAMSTLENIDFFKNGTSYTFVSLWSLLLKCVTAANGGYGSLYFPWVYSTIGSEFNSPYANNNVLNNMTVSEQNFFDEEGVPMKMNEVLEEICKLLGWTCVDYVGDLYFIDPDHSIRESPALNSSNKGKYIGYYLGTINNYHLNVYPCPEINLQTLGFAGNDNSIDKIPGFNKVSVKTSTFPVQNIFPTEDFKTLELYYSQPDVISSDGTIKAVKRFLTPSTYKCHIYTPDSAQTEIGDISQVSHALVNTYLGARPIKRTTYKVSDNPSSLTFNELIQVRYSTATANTGFQLGALKPFLEFSEDLPVAAYWKGAFGIKCSVQLDLYWPSYSMNYFQDKPYPNFAALNLFAIPVVVSIGNKYLQDNGTWSTTWNAVQLSFNTVELLKGVFVPANTTKQLSDPYNNGDTALTGLLIKLPSDAPLCGKLNVSFLSPVIQTNYAPDKSSFPGFYIDVKGFGIDYKILDDVADKISTLSDRHYENVVNDAFMNEADGIDLKISTWNNTELCYSNAVLGTSFLTNNLYCILTNNTVRLEEMLINRIIDQYSTIKDKTTQILNNSETVLPFCEIVDDYFPEKKFLQIGGSIDFKAETMKLKAIEKSLINNT